MLWLLCVLSSVSKVVAEGGKSEGESFLFTYTGVSNKFIASSREDVAAVAMKENEISKKIDQIQKLLLKIVKGNLLSF